MAMSKQFRRQIEKEHAIGINPKYANRQSERNAMGIPQQNWEKAERQWNRDHREASTATISMSGRRA